MRRQSSWGSERRRSLGLLNLFFAIAVIAGSDMFITEAEWLVGDARPWG